MKYFFKSFIFIFLLFISISLVSYSDSSPKSTNTEDKIEVGNRYEKLQVFAKVLNLIKKYYVEDVDVQKLIYGGIKGMLAELDPHTNFLPPKLFKEFESETSGEFDGIGIEISVQDEILTVISPIEDTPAWEAGIKAGDKIISINGDQTKGLSLVEAAQKMKGKSGTSVKLEVVREGLKEPKSFTITRGKVKTRSVKYTNLDDGYGYFRITSFIERTSNDLKREIKRHKSKNKTVKGIIIDLRNNPGGLLDQAIKTSNMFLEKGIIVSTIGRDKREKDITYAKSDNTMKDFPIIILINEYSASASEILAGALQDNGRALIMGQRSFGKGSVQSVVKLGDGSGLKMTVARYYTPNGTSIQAEGIIPDIVVENVNPEAYQNAIIQRKVRREGDIQGHLLGEKEKKKALSKNKKEVNKSQKDKLLDDDFQVSQAYNYLKSWKVFRKMAF